MIKDYLSLLFRLLLSLSLVLPSVSFARVSNPAATYALSEMNYFRTTENVLKSYPVGQEAFYKADQKGEVSKISSEKSKVIDFAMEKGVKPIGHIGPLLLLLVIMAWIEAFVQSWSFSELQNKELTFAEVYKLAGEAAVHTVDNFDIWSSIIGGTATGISMQGVMKGFENILHSTSAKPIFQKFLLAGANSFLVFIGWELGGQLWREAVFNLNSDDEMRPGAMTAEQKITLALKLSFYKVLSGKGSYQEVRIFQEVFDNAFNILSLEKPDLAKDWIYNTWRLRLSTGDFVIMLGAATTAGVAGGIVGAKVGGAVHPLFGWFLGGFCGFVGGLTGVAVGHYAPSWMKDPVTRATQNMRSNQSRQRLITNEYELLRLIKYATDDAELKGIVGEKHEKKIENPNIGRHKQSFAKYLDARQNYRNDGITAYFEEYAKQLIRLRDTNAKIDSLNKYYSNNKPDMAKVRSDFDAVSKVLDVGGIKEDQLSEANLYAYKFDLGKASANAKAKLDAIENAIFQYYFQEGESLGKLYFTYENSLPGEWKDLVLEELMRVQYMIFFVQRIIASVNPSKAEEYGVKFETEDEKQKMLLAAQIHINTAQMRGFVESRLFDNKKTNQ